MSSAESAPLVFDLGCSNSRFGFAGEDLPRLSWPSRVGIGSTPDSIECPLSSHALIENFNVHPIFQEAEGCEDGSLSVAKEAVEALVKCAASQLRSSGSGWGREERLTCPVLVTEPTRRNLFIRKGMAEVLFEKFQVSSGFFAKQAVLTSYAVARFKALVIELGGKGVEVAPVVDGYVQQKNIRHARVGGEILDEELGKLIRAYAEKEVDPFFACHRAVRVLDESNPGTSSKVVEDRRQDLSNVAGSYLDWAKADVVREIREKVCRVAASPEEAASQMEEVKKRGGQVTENSSAAANASSSSASAAPSHPPVAAAAAAAAAVKPDPGAGSADRYVLPDGTEIETAPYVVSVYERLFDPSLMPSIEGFEGLPQMVVSAVSGVDSEIRRELLGATVLTGGLAMAPGMSNRIGRELKKRPELGMGSGDRLRMVRFPRPEESICSAWIGGSIFASLGSFREAAVTREEWEESGLKVLENKCP